MDPNKASPANRRSIDSLTRYDNLIRPGRLNARSMVTRRRFLIGSAFSISAVAGGAPLIGPPSVAAAGWPRSTQNSDRVRAAVGSLMDRMKVQPSEARQANIESLVSTLVETQIWDRLDGLYVFAAHDVQAARLNWVQGTFDITSVNSPAFEADVGFAGDGVAAFLDTNAIATALANFKANDATMGVYVHSPLPSETDMDIGLVDSYLNVCADSNNICLRANSSSGAPVTAPNSAETTGLVAWSRDSTNVHIFSYGEPVASTKVAVGHLKSLPITILRVESNYSTRRISAAVVGGGLSVQQHSALSGALDSYVGAIR